VQESKKASSGDEDKDGDDANVDGDESSPTSPTSNVTSKGEGSKREEDEVITVGDWSWGGLNIDVYNVVT